MALSTDIEERVEALLRQLTLQEKVFMLSGRDSWSTMPVERALDGAPHGIPGLVMTDGPHGVRANQPDAGRAISSPTTAFPTGISMASTWNPALVEQAARALGEETKAMGCDILLGPCVNIVRTPIAGRNFETYSEDPYLAGWIGAAYVKGVQSAGAGTSLKHFAANNQETERFRGSSQVDERTLREIYLPQFERVVKETQPWTVMCSYNRINGVYASQNHHLLNEILKDEWGFEGVVVSDWTANHTTTESVKGGLDLEMPGPAKWYGNLLLEAVNLWQIEEAEVDQAVRRILRMIIRSGKLDGTDPKGSVNTPEHQAVARSVAEEAITLLKNRDGILPLQPRALHHLAIIGPAAADMAVSGGGSAYTEPPYRVTPLMALRQALGQQVELGFEPGCDNFQRLPLLKAAYVRPARSSNGETSGLYGEYFSGTGFDGEPFLQRVDPRLSFWWFQSGPTTGIGSRFSARWTGKLEVPTSERYTFRLVNTGSVRLYLDDRLVLENVAEQASLPNNETAAEQAVELAAGRSYDLRLELLNAQGAEHTHIEVGFAATPEQDQRIERAVALAKDADVALVFVGDTEQLESEGFDRTNLRLPGQQDELVARVAAANPNTIVVLNVGAPVEMPWIDQVAAVVLAYFPGLEGGAAIERVLTGAVNPSGKLTVTYPRRFEDSPSYLNLSVPEAREVQYGEGIFVGYRYFDSTGVQPLFPFGHGLSYTTFSYANMEIPAEAALSGLENDPITVSVDVTNTGSTAGKEVVQVYVSDLTASLPRPKKELKGFEKVSLQPGETKTVRFTLDRRALAYYDPARKGWVVEPGAFEILVGSSAADIRARGTLVVK